MIREDLVSKKKDIQLASFVFKKNAGQNLARRSIGGTFANKKFTTARVKNNNFINQTTAKTTAK